jgi:single-strand DNA-binding protein
MALNKAIFMGNLTRDPESRQAGETTVANFSVAVNETWGSGDDRKEKTSFIDCKAFGKLADNIVKYLKKGRKVAIEGSLDQESWEDKEGNKRNKLVVKVSDFTFVDSPDKNDSAGSAPRKQGGQKEAVKSQGGNDDIPF